MSVWRIDAEISDYCCCENGLAVCTGELFSTTARKGLVPEVADHRHQDPDDDGLIQEEGRTRL